MCLQPPDGVWQHQAVLHLDRGHFQAEQWFSVDSWLRLSVSPSSTQPEPPEH